MAVADLIAGSGITLTFSGWQDASRHAGSLVASKLILGGCPSPWRASQNDWRLDKSESECDLPYPEPGPDKFAYCALCFTAETSEQAEEGARKLLWYLNKRRPVGFFAPPGFVPPQALLRFYATKGSARYNRTLDQLLEQGVIIAGTPDVVREKIEYLYRRTGVGHLLMMNQAGFLNADETRRSMKLFAREVYPAVRELGET